MSAFDWIRKNYGVPAKRFGRVEYKGDKGGDGVLGTITGVQNSHLLIRLDGQKHSFPYHPTWQLRYLEATPEGEVRPLSDQSHRSHKTGRAGGSPCSVPCQCDKCTATMGHSDSEDGAIEAWNRRIAKATSPNETSEGSDESKGFVSAGAKDAPARETDMADFASEIERLRRELSVEREITANLVWAIEHPLDAAVNDAFIAAAEQMITHEDAGGDGWWKGFEMLKAAYAAKQAPEGN